MANNETQPRKESAIERMSRFGRNVNLLGAMALAGLATVIPGPNVVLGSWAAFNAVQAGGFEAVRKSAESSRKRKNHYH